MMGILLFVAFSAILALGSFLLGYVIGRVYREIVEYIQKEKENES